MGFAVILLRVDPQSNQSDLSFVGRASILFIVQHGEFTSPVNLCITLLYRCLIDFLLDRDREIN